jgi:hypothetical protein
MIPYAAIWPEEEWNSRPAPSAIRYSTARIQSIPSQSRSTTAEWQFDAGIRKELGLNYGEKRQSAYFLSP